ncbi:uncharacterized protein [Antedon mediterranea]|uniref:uncharacterized protein n=1 Tax=Antedon mediterranea TaxID=105859 RepID=UPI003AF8F6C9
MAASSNYESTHLLSIEPNTYWSNTTGQVTSSDPVDVEFDIDGNILVCNATDEILRFSQQGKFLSRFSVGLDRKIRGMSCNEKDEIFMTDGNAKEVIVCDDEGKVTSNISVLDPSENKEKVNIRGLVVSDKSGEVFVIVDYQVRRLKKDGKLLNKIGINDTGSYYRTGKLEGPCYIALDENQNVLVNDGNQKRVQVFRPDGQFVRSLRGGRQIERPHLGCFDVPGGIAVFENGSVAVGCQRGLFVCKNKSYGPVIRRFDDENSSNSIMGTKGIATYRNVMAVAITVRSAEPTIELFKYDY